MITKTRVFLLLAIVVIAYAGLKGYLYFRTKSQIDNLAAAAAPFAELEYGSVGSTLGGAIEIDDIVIRPLTYNDTVNIGRLSLQTPGLLFLLNGQKAIRNGELPENLSLTLERVRLPLNGDLAEALEELEASGDNNGTATADRVCTLSHASITSQYRRLGEDEMVLDASFMFERGDTSSEVRLAMDYSLDGIEKGGVTATLDGMGRSIQSTAVSTPRLASMRAYYNPDPAFIDKLLEYCAEQDDTDTATFVDRLFDQSDDRYAAELGFVPGPGIRDGLKRLVTSRGELRITADPLSPVDFSTMHLYKREDWPGLFGLSVFVNDKPVSDLSFHVPAQNNDQANSEESLFDFSEAPGSEPENKPTPDKKPPSPVTPQHEESPAAVSRSVDKNDIHNLIGEHVNIVTSDGKPRSGTVLKVERGLIYLKRQFSSGTLSTRVPLDSVARVEIVQ